VSTQVARRPDVSGLHFLPTSLNPPVGPVEYADGPRRISRYCADRRRCR
jgi:hypothetical protein